MTAAEPVAPLTRRERQRQATYDEIVEVSRRLLAETQALSLRAVATEMGMTAPALYRYVNGYDELVMLVAKAIFADVVTSIRATVAEHPDDDPGAQLVTATVAFRSWALSHPDEFQVIFANREVGTYHSEGGKDSSMEFAQVFSDIFLRTYHRYRFDLPGDDELPPPLAAGLEEARRQGAFPCEFPGEPVALIWIFLRMWSRLYGTVTQEVFGHVDDMIVKSGALFAAMMDDNGRELNLGDDFPRLRALIRGALGPPWPETERPT
jgi:AcrR family transcriptional regulator